jgi:Mg2+-importing ATPase
LLTQTLIIHVIRTNKIPFLQSRASWPVVRMGLLIVAAGVGLSFSRAGGALGFTTLPRLYWPLLALTLACYLTLTQGVKTWLLRQRWI